MSSFRRWVLNQEPKYKLNGTVGNKRWKRVLKQGKSYEEYRKMRENLLVFIFSKSGVESEGMTKQEREREDSQGQ